MAVKLSPYLSFKDNARPAMEFYQTVFGGKLDISTFKDYQMAQSPTEENLVMHGILITEHDLTLMGSDTPGHMEYKPGVNAFSVALSGELDDEPTLRSYFDKLAVGGTIAMPMDKAPWGDIFGMCVDQFGITWLVNITATPAVAQ